MSRKIRIHTPDGRVHERTNEYPRSRLSDWLELQHLPLNTRCGGRGLCRGCLVEADDRQQRACQILCDSVSEIQIPDPSLRDHRINGVSAFEIGHRPSTLRSRPGIGLALDIGTTTVAAALWDLETGSCLASGSIANEQRRYGDNVLSRIDHAVSLGGRSPALQAALVRDSLVPLIDSLRGEVGLDRMAITEAMAAGNTVMLHGLVGAPLSGFASYPFQPVFLDAQNLVSTEIGFPAAFPVQLAANLGPFVGADIAVGALASGMLERDGAALLIDFGTNGEILLKTRDGYLATATAAGPAFEGGRLNCGSAANQGVISALSREQESWRIRFTGESTIARSTGIAGAAYVDFMQHAVEAGIMNEMGRFDRSHPEVYSQTTEDGSELRVTVHQQQFVSETDVAELIQAKAAIAAGVMTLLDEAEVEAEALQTVYIAGGFGYHLNALNAMAIGMMPAVDPGRIRIIGNASLGGASLLLQTDSGAEVEALREQCHVIELNQVESFEDHFIDCMPLTKIG